MEIVQILHFWILITSVVSKSTATADEIIEKYEKAKPLIDYVDADTYKNFVREGMTTFIFYGADWCQHCRQFTPVWLDFQDAAKKNKFNEYFHVKKVECTTNVDLCSSISAYPTVHLYEDGKMTLDINDVTLEPLIEKGKLTYERMKKKTEGVFASLKLLLDQDTYTTAPSQGKNVDLTDETFNLLTSKGLWLIKFYAPWCGHCKHLAPIWEELGHKIKEGVNIGAVDCTVHKNACKKFQVQGYPTIIFINGDYKENYFGARTLNSLEEFAQKQVNRPPFKIVEAAGIQKIYEENPSVLIFTYDGLADESIVKPMVSTIYEVAKSIKGKIPVYFCPEKKGLEKVKVGSEVSVLAIFRDGGLDHLFYESPLKSIDDIRKWVLDNKEPLVPELTESNQGELSKSRILLVAMIDPDNPKDKLVLKELITAVQSIRQKMKNFDNVKFTWLNGVKFSAYIKSVYGLDSSTFPRFVVTSPKDELYFKVHADGAAYSFTEKSIISAINDALEEKGIYHSTKGTLGLMILKSSRHLQWLWRLMTNSMLSMIWTIGILGGFVYYFCFRGERRYVKIADVESKFD